MINVGSLGAKAFNVLRCDSCVVIATAQHLEEGEQQVYAQRKLEMWPQGEQGRKT